MILYKTVTHTGTHIHNISFKPGFLRKKYLYKSLLNHLNYLVNLNQIGLKPNKALLVS